MKYLLISFILLSNSQCKENENFKDSIKININEPIEYESFKIKNISIKDLKKDKLFKLLGKPDNTKKVYNEIIGVYQEEYCYLKSCLYYESDLMVGFEVNDGLIILDDNRYKFNRILKVGLKVKNNDGIYKLQFIYNKKLIDIFLIIEVKENQIIRLYSWEPS